MAVEPLCRAAAAALLLIGCLTGLSSSAVESVELLDPARLSGSPVIYRHPGDLSVHPAPLVEWHPEEAWQEHDPRTGRAKQQIRQLVLEPLALVTREPISRFSVSLEADSDHPVRIDHWTIDARGMRRHTSVVTLSSPPPWPDEEIAAARDAGLAVEVDLDGDGSAERVEVLKGPIPLVEWWYNAVGIFVGPSPAPAWLSQTGEESLPEVTSWSWEGSKSRLLEVEVPFSDGAYWQYVTMDSGGIRELVRWRVAYECCWSKVVPVPEGPAGAAEALLYSEPPEEPTGSTGERILAGSQPIRFFHALDVSPGVPAEGPLEMPQITVPLDESPCGPAEIRIVSFLFEPGVGELGPPRFLCGDPSRL